MSLVLRRHALRRTRSRSQWHWQYAAQAVLVLAVAKRKQQHVTNTQHTLSTVWMLLTAQ